MHQMDRALINRLQDGLPICDQPFLEVGKRLDMSEDEVLERIQRLLDCGMLTRFGPMFHAEQLGGGLTLAAMKIPDEEFDRINELVNAFPEVAHNYQRNHEFNMWFVLATEKPEGVAQTIKAIEETTGYAVYNMPKQEEFYVGLRFTA